MTAPNLINLQGHHVTVTYSTTGLDGQPHLTYHDPQRSLAFSGDEITIEAVPPLGTLVSVTLVEVPDLGVTTFTLLVPKIVLDRGDLTHVHTEGITAISRTSFAPQLDRGQRQSYTVVALSGTAQLVDF